MKIDISKKDRLTIEAFNGSADKGQAFAGIRFRIGKRKPKTIFHFHHSKVWEIIEALKMAVSDVDENKGSFYESPQWQRLDMKP